jgi:hypothetical protein
MAVLHGWCSMAGAAWLCSMVVLHGCAAWLCCMVVQHGCALWAALSRLPTDRMNINLIMLTYHVGRCNGLLVLHTCRY